jgi:hypothetical protein
MREVTSPSPWKDGQGSSGRPQPHTRPGRDIFIHKQLGKSKIYFNEIINSLDYPLSKKTIITHFEPEIT